MCRRQVDTKLHVVCLSGSGSGLAHRECPQLAERTGTRRFVLVCICVRTTRQSGAELGRDTTLLFRPMVAGISSFGGFEMSASAQICY